MAFALIDGVVNDDDDVAVLVESKFPPEEASYQRKVPAVVASADNSTVPLPQCDPATPTGVAGTVLTIAFTALLAELQLPSLNAT